MVDVQAEGIDARDGAPDRDAGLRRVQGFDRSSGSSASSPARSRRRASSRANSGTQSVQVPISTVAVQADASTGKHEEGDFTFFDASTRRSRTRCAASATPGRTAASQTRRGGARSSLLRREALELALYTLKYVPNTDAVITYLPPPGDPGVAAKAILISRKDVKREPRPSAQADAQAAAGRPGWGPPRRWARRRADLVPDLHVRLPDLAQRRVVGPRPDARRHRGLSSGRE